MINFSIAITAFIVWVVGGGILLAVSASWRPQPGKRLFIAYVSLMFLVLPIMELVFLATWMYWENYYSQWQYYGRGSRPGELFSVLYFVNTVFVILVLLLSQWLLVIYALGRQRGEEFVLDKTASKSGSSLQEEERRWNVSRQGAELVAILRRREWAFLIDIAPCLLLVAIFVFVLNVFFGVKLYRRVAGQLFTLFVLVEILGVIYLVLKDVIDGQSIGKRITGCRAIDFATGGPLKMEQAVTRNLVYLIPLFPLVELAAACFRNDRRRFGDLIAGTIVVPAEPDVINGIVQVSQAALQAKAETPRAKHPLDD